MEKKKYLIASGCSFTQGHGLGKSASWATYMPYEIINLGKGGRGNRLITQVPISFGMMNPDIAKDSLFIIQLSECLRTLVHYDSELKKYGEISGLLKWELIIIKPIKKPSKYAPLSPSIKILKMLSNKSSKSVNIIKLID